MTLVGNFNQELAQSSSVHDSVSILYCSHQWSNSNLKQSNINPVSRDNKLTKYCYTCRGKIRSYGITPKKEHFLPIDHSTPKIEIKPERTEESSGFYRKCGNDPNKLNDNINKRTTSINDINISSLEVTQYIPTISRQVDLNLCHKYTSEPHEQLSNDVSQRRLRKSLKGIGCIVNWSLTESPKKRRTQIQACSISVMIIAIVVISLVLVNVTTFNFNHIKNDKSTSSVPIENVNISENSSAIVHFYTDLTAPEVKTMTIADTTTPTMPVLTTTKNNSLLNNVILKIRKNIKTYPKNDHKRQESVEPKELIINKNLSQRFCSCQTNQVCMLDEISGKSVCKDAVDVDDPTGCGGLCALETEACHLVDKLRGVRVCRLLTQVTCSSHDWRCRNGFCVSSEARCDGYIHCYDRSDEMHCECDLTKQFRCGHSISCFPNKKLCDGLIDCWDGSDELNCTLECPDNQFTCTNGQCIMSSRFCDGLADCSDKSDEPQGCDGACGTHEMQCNNQRCVPHAVQCDGRDDCGDGTDEYQCS